MISPFKAAWVRIKPNIPDLFTKGRFNFITIHYCYISGMALLGSVFIYAIGGIPYIDALFFACGGSTQSGLNTIDVNKIHTGQQFILYMLSMLCNPIVIHSSVVFVRLHWFEKSFKNIVEEAQKLRRSKSKSRYASQAKGDPELGGIEKSVRGRSIVVLRHGHPFEGALEAEKAKADATAESVSSSARNEGGKDSDHAAQNEALFGRRGAVGADDTGPDAVQSPLRHNVDHHIAFLENQRSPKDKSTLRIPSPREFDRGGQPEDVGDEETAALTRRVTNRPQFDTVGFGNAPLSGNHIIINEPRMSRSQDKTGPLATAGFDKRGSRTSSAQPSTSMLSRVKPRAGTDLKGLVRASTSFLRTREQEPKEEAPYLSWVPTIARNSTFVNLNEEQRDELGGIEYRALKTLATVLIAYFFAFHILGFICLVPWIMTSARFGSVVTNVGQGRVWWAIFTSGSHFNDLGFTLTPDSMISFSRALFPLLFGTFLIIIGNTGFPCMLRFVIWLTSTLTPRHSALWEELKFLLDHPRRCFTLLFPRSATWWLFAILVILNVVDLIFFVILDLNEPPVSELSAGWRVVNGLYQAASTRTAGFAVVNLALLHPGVQVSYLIMMYISVFPIAISMRRTNVYEEKSLGIYGTTSNQTEGDDAEPSYVGAHLRKQLSFDLWYVFLGLFLIAVIEGDRIENTNDYAFTMFSVLFEIISAYGTVGLSLGYPTINASFSGEFRTLSKLIILAMQIRGRHRGLPYELDRAILLPSQSLREKEEAEAQNMLARRRTSLNISNANTHSRTRVSLNPFNPSPIRDQTIAPPTVEEKDHGEESAEPEDVSDHGENPPVRSGLGNAMFHLKSPVHRQSTETKQD